MFISPERNVRAYRDLRQTSTQLFSLDAVPKEMDNFTEFAWIGTEENNFFLWQVGVMVEAVLGLKIPYDSLTIL